MRALGVSSRGTCALLAEARLAYSHVVVLDSFFGEAERAPLLSQLTESAWDHAQVSFAPRSGFLRAHSEGRSEVSPQRIAETACRPLEGFDPNTLLLMQGPPAAKWERETADTHLASRTWGLRDHMLRQLAEEPSQAMLEVNTRLARLYPEYDIALMPAEHMQSASLDPQPSSKAPTQATPNAKRAEHLQSTSLDRQPSSKPLEHAKEHPSSPGGKIRGMASSTAAAAAAWLQADSAAAEPGSGAHVRKAGGAQQDSSSSRSAASDDKPAAHGEAAYCAAFVGNAPVHGDSFCYHVDADPAGLPPSRCAQWSCFQSAALPLLHHLQRAARDCLAA